MLLDAGNGAGGREEDGECRTGCRGCAGFVFMGTLVLLVLLGGGGAAAILWPVFFAGAAVDKAWRLTCASSVLS